MGKPHDQHHVPKPKSAVETTLTLKVLIHCEGCKRKVKRIIKCVDGVESVNIEPQIGKVTVSGKGVDARDVLQSLQEAGKFAEIWQFGGGKLPPMNQPFNFNPVNSGKNKPNTNPHQGMKDNSSNILTSVGGNMKAVGWEKPNQEDSKSLNTKGKGSENMNNFGVNGLGSFDGGKMEFSQSGPHKPPFLSGELPRGGQFARPMPPTNNVAIMSRSVAPMPSIYRGEASGSPVERAEYDTADYATHLFSDENANNCSIM